MRLHGHLFVKTDVFRQITDAERVTARRASQNRHFALGRLNQSQNGFDQCGLARTIVPDQGGERSCPQPAAHTVQHFAPASPEPDALNANRFLHAAHCAAPLTTGAVISG